MYSGVSERCCGYGGSRDEKAGEIKERSLLSGDLTDDEVQARGTWDLLALNTESKVVIKPEEHSWIMRFGLPHRALQPTHPRASTQAPD